MTSNLDQLRSDLTPDQQRLVDRIWTTYYLSNGNTWPIVLDTQIEFEMSRVLAAVEALPAGTVFEEGGHYRMGLLGALLAKDGHELETRIAGYLDYVRAEKRKDLALSVIQSRDVAAALSLAEVDCMMLSSALHLGQLGGERGAGAGPVWAAGIPEDLPRLMSMSRSELESFVSDRAVSMAKSLAHARNPQSPPRNDFWFIAVPALRALLEADWDELQRVRGVNASKSCVILSGGILEAMLLDTLGGEADRAAEAFKLEYKKTPATLDRWQLVELVAVAGRLGMIPSAAIHLSQALREFRNLVHPGKQLRESVHLSGEEADMSTAIVEMCLRAIAKYQQGRASIKS